MGHHDGTRPTPSRTGSQSHRAVAAGRFALLIALAACGPPTPEVADTTAPTDAAVATDPSGVDGMSTPTDSSALLDTPEDAPVQAPVRIRSVTRRTWATAYDTAFGVQTDPGWRHEVPGVRIPGLAFPEVGRNKNGVARLRALGGTPDRRVIVDVPRLEEWQWGDSLSITVNLDADRLTYLRWGPKDLPWIPTRDRFVGWQLIQTDEDGEGATALGRLIADPDGPVILVSPGDGKIVIVEVTWSLPGRFSS